jgi:transposase
MARTRRNFSAEFKAKVVLEIISGSKTAAEVCRECNLKADLVSHWKNEFLTSAAQVFENGMKVDPQQAQNYLLFDFSIASTNSLSLISSA